MAKSFLVSPNARQLTVDKSTLSAAAYARATDKSESMLLMSDDGGSTTASSTGVLPLPPIAAAGHSTAMADKSLKGILKRINRRLTATDMSAQAASTEAGLSKDAIRNIKRAAEDANGTRSGVQSRTITALAVPLKTTSNWLLTGEGAEELDEDMSRRTVEVVGYVGAGAEAHFYAVSQGNLDEVDAPDNSSQETKAVEIRGDSLGSLFDRWLVFYDDVRSPITPDLVGKLCVVGLADDRVLIKKVRSGSRKGFYQLVSEREPPIVDVAIEWAAKVKTMVPR